MEVPKGSPQVTFGAGFSASTNTKTALAEAAGQALAELAPGPAPDLVLFFATPNHTEDKDSDLGRELRERTGARALIGCAATGVIGAGKEREANSALSLLLARLPEASIRPFHLAPQTERGDPPLSRWREQLALPDAGTVLVVLLTDPYSVDATRFMQMVESERPDGVPVVGGVVTGGNGLGENRLFVQDLCEASGAVGLVISGAFQARTVVSQGCKPIGRHMVITRAREHVIFQIGQKPALKAFEEVLESLDPGDRKLAERSLHVGRVIDEQKSAFGRGDFLIRNPIGADFERGAVAVGDVVRAGQTIQLHVRDARTAEDDLRSMLRGSTHAGAHAKGALLFSCTGRGRHMFGAEGHDSGVIAEELGPIPMAGFFCGGEFGPIGGRNFVHGYTSTVLLFC